MRLIDADALQQHFADMQKYERCACNFVDDGGEPATEWYCVEDALENAPTIDAIPVEWLRGYTAVGVAPTGDRLTEGKERLIVHRILNEWQKEQEAR